MSKHEYEAGRLNLPFVGISTFGKKQFVENWDEIDADVAILGAPFDCGCQFRPGARFGPRSVREASTLFSFGHAGAFDHEDDATYLGEDVRIRLYTDSAAALGIIGRRGLGKVRHLETGYLWLQDLVAKKKIGVAKVKGTDNPADLGTKYLRSEDVDKHLRFLRYYKEDGRSIVVPSI